MATRLISGGLKEVLREDGDFPFLTQQTQTKVSRRSPLEIKMDILRVVRDGEGSLGPTQIMYKANLSWMALKEQLPPLVKLGMVLEHKARRRLVYSITGRGMEALREYLSVVSQFEDLGLDLLVSDRGHQAASLGR